MSIKIQNNITGWLVWCKTQFGVESSSWKLPSGQMKWPAGVGTIWSGFPVIRRYNDYHHVVTSQILLRLQVYKTWHFKHFCIKIQIIQNYSVGSCHWYLSAVFRRPLRLSNIKERQSVISCHYGVYGNWVMEG